MNVVYTAMTKRLKHDDKNPNAPRHNFDRLFDVDAWQVPGGARVRRDRVEGAPSWWHGDEDASQSFLQSMGVITGG